MIADWGDEGEIDLLDFFAELTIYTSSACLIGKKFREQLDGRFARLYHQLEQGTDPLCYVDPYLPIESFRLRDEARLGLVELVQEIMNDRIANPPKDKSDRDMLDVLVTIKRRGGQPAILRQRDHRHVHLDDVRRAPHQLRHGIVDVDRDAAPPRRVRRRGGRTGGALRRRPGSQFPCAAPDSETGERPQGDAAAASAADHPDAGGQGRVRGGGLSDPRGRDGGGVACDLQPDRRGLPGPGRVRAGPLREAAPGRPDQPVDLDSVRRRSPPLRRRRVRHHADQGDLLGSVARVRIRDGTAIGVLSERPLEDGGAAGPARQGALPLPEPLGGDSKAG